MHKDREAPEDIEVREVAVDGAKEVPIVDLLVLAKLKPSKAEARRVVQQGGVKVNGQRAGIDTAVSVAGEPTVQVGKRSFARIRFR